MNFLKKFLKRNKPVVPTSPEYNAFINTDLSKYKQGEYVIFTEEGVYDHGYNLTKMTKKFKKNCPNKTPAVFKVPPKHFAFVLSNEEIVNTN